MRVSLWLHGCLLHKNAPENRKRHINSRCSLAESMMVGAVYLAKVLPSKRVPQRNSQRQWKWEECFVLLKTDIMYQHLLLDTLKINVGVAWASFGPKQAAVKHFTSDIFVSLTNISQPLAKRGFNPFCLNAGILSQQCLSYRTCSMWRFEILSQVQAFWTSMIQQNSSHLSCLFVHFSAAKRVTILFGGCVTANLGVVTDWWLPVLQVLPKLPGNLVNSKGFLDVSGISRLNTVDGSEFRLWHGKYPIIFTGFYTSQVVQDFFHQQYHPGWMDMVMWSPKARWEVSFSKLTYSDGISHSGEGIVGTFLFNSLHLTAIMSVFLHTNSHPNGSKVSFAF